MIKTWFRTFAVVALIAALALTPIACTKSPTPVGPDPTAEPSPTPSPTPTPQHVLVGMDFYQDGQRVTDKGVRHGADFKIVVTERCFNGDTGLAETCPFNPYVNIYQTAGFGGMCTVWSTSSEGYAIASCDAPILDTRWRGCLQDWNKVTVGECAESSLNVG